MRLLPSGPDGAFGNAFTGFAVTAMYGTINEYIVVPEKFIF
jgi:hypothetical protein